MYGGLHYGLKKQTTAIYDFETQNWTLLDQCPIDAGSGDALLITDQSGNDVVLVIGNWLRS